MAIGCEEVSTRMMELLYGELSGENRAAVEAHLSGCASCRAELAAFQATRVAARRALDEDAPPARAHQAILRAAAAAVAAKQPQPIEARAVPARRPFRERLRARWTLPTFATIGAVAVVVLASKVFLEPDKTVELGRQALRETPAAAPAAPPTEAAAQPEAQEKARTTAQGAASERKKEISLDLAERPAADKELARSVAAPPAHHRRAAPADGFGALDGLTKGGGSGGPARAKAPALDDLISGENKPTTRPAPAKREFAPPPPPRGERAGASATGSDQMKDRDLDENALEGAAPPGAGKGRIGGGAGAAPPAAHAAKAKKTEKADSPMEPERDRAPATSAPAPAPSAPVAEEDEGRRAEAQEKSKDKTDDGPETKTAARPRAEPPVAHADRLFAEGRWAEAARAYRELLRRDPHNADAARWRQRLAASEAAAAPEAPAAASPPAR